MKNKLLTEGVVDLHEYINKKIFIVLLLFEQLFANSTGMFKLVIGILLTDHLLYLFRQGQRAILVKIEENQK